MILYLHTVLGKGKSKARCSDSVRTNKLGIGLVIGLGFLGYWVFGYGLG